MVWRIGAHTMAASRSSEISFLAVLNWSKMLAADRKPPNTGNCASIGPSWLCRPRTILFELSAIMVPPDIA